MSDKELIDKIAEMWVENGGDRDGLLWVQSQLLERISEKMSEKETMVPASRKLGRALAEEIFPAAKRVAEFGSNAGQRCDTDDGPCSCGAWH